MKPHDDGFPVPSVEGGTGENSVEAPDEILRQVGVEAMFRLLLVDFVEQSRRKLRVTLMGGRIRRNVQFLDRLGHRRNRKLDHEWSGRRACDSVTPFPAIRAGPSNAWPPVKHGKTHQAQVHQIASCQHYSCSFRSASWPALGEIGRASCRESSARSG